MARPHGRAALADDGARVPTARDQAHHAGSRWRAAPSGDDASASMRSVCESVGVDPPSTPCSASASAAQRCATLAVDQPPAIHDTLALLIAAEEQDASFGPCSGCSPRPEPAGEVCGLRWTDIDVRRRRSASAAPSPRSPEAPSSRTPRHMPPARSPSMLERSRSQHRRRVEELARACRPEFNPDGYCLHVEPPTDRRRCIPTPSPAASPAVRPSRSQRRSVA